MQAYESFARVYDELMDNVPYDEWCNYLLEILRKNNIQQGCTICELGCGTGSVTERLAENGYKLIGIDYSEDMLSIAMEKRAYRIIENDPDEDNDNIHYLHQDMRELDLGIEVDAVISICDSINYITAPEDLVTTFKKVKESLSDEGIFVFDFNTRYYYSETVGETTIAEDREDVSFIWDNYYDEEENVNELALTLFIRKDDSNLYEKFEELHLQRGYTFDEMKDIIEKSGMNLVAAYKAFSYDKPDDETDRIYFIVKK